jgi:uroporphyrin-III C-methyltransferase/precorrin-2 dehydrogenase/sirohydrochlorin ferrochelatase
MRHYPIFLDLAGRKVLVLGEGEAVRRRAAELASAGAVVRTASHFAPDLLDGVVLACGSGASDADLATLSNTAQARGIPVNIIDRPELSSYITPARIDRDPLTIAIATGGAAPVLARQIRAKIEAIIPPGFGRLAAWIGKFQTQIRAAIPNLEARRRFLDRALSGPIAEQVFAGDIEGADAALTAELAAGTESSTPGIVHLVGAGPGAADLISLRGLRLLGEADVIVHDRLGTAVIRDLARRDAARIDVGKSHGDHTMPQPEINALLVALAREGKTVVRLKGGDPFIFGRGGEELAALREAGIAYTVVPGITAALACAASAGLPLTHRDAAHAVTFVTAHRRASDLPSNIPELLRPGMTLAIYMGLASLPRLCDELAAAGQSLDLPAALIEDGGTEAARVLRGPLRILRDQAPGWSSGGPCLILLGGTAGLIPPPDFPKIS